MVTYRTTGEWGVGLGVNLTASQVDFNFDDTVSALDAVEAALPEPRELGAWNVTGYDLSIVMGDNFFGPWRLPLVTMKLYGRWQIEKILPEAVMFISPTAELFLTTQAHTVESTEWDEFEEGETGSRLYYKFWGNAPWMELAAYYPGEPLTDGEEPLFLHYATRPFFISPGTFEAETETSTETETESATEAPEVPGYVFARVAPSTEISLPILLNGVSVGTLMIPGGFVIPSTVQVEVGDVLSIPQAADMFGARDVSFVLKTRRGRP